MGPNTPNNTPSQRSQPRYQPRRPVVANNVHESRPQTVQPAETAAVPVGSASPIPSQLTLPAVVVSRADVSRCLREVEELDNFFHQASLRGSKVQSLPKLGHVLDGLSAANGLNMIHAQHRDALKTFLTHLKAKAPVVHMSFPSEAGADFTTRLLTWFRTEAHPHTVLHIGLQPELAAGCTMRTSNKFFDFSFRARFEKSKEKLVAALEAADKAAQAVPAGIAQPAPAAQAAAAPASPPTGGAGQ